MPTKKFKVITTHKRCTGCGRLFPRNIENFYKNNHNYDGFTTRCRECTRTYRSNYMDSNLSRNHDNYLKNKENGNIKKYKKNRRKDVTNILIDNLRSRIWSLLNRTNNKSKKYFKHDDVLGCSPAFLRDYLESLFTEGMSWDNYGMGGWWIDHIKPCDSFKPFTEEQQKKCFHYTNLQPLWWYDNISKGNKLP